MSCPSPSSLLLLLLIHPDHMECGLFIYVCFGSCAEISTSISLCTVFLFNSCIHRIDIEDYFFKCIRTYSIFTYSQFLMTHLGFLYPYIHQPYNLFKKNTKKIDMRCFFGLAQACCGALGICRRNSDGSLAQEHCLDAGMAFVETARSWKSHFPWLPSQIAKLLEAQLLNRFEISSWD